MTDRIKREKPLGTTHKTVCSVCGRGGVWCYSVAGRYICIDRCAEKSRAA